MEEDTRSSKSDPLRSCVSLWNQTLGARAKGQPTPAVAFANETHGDVLTLEGRRRSVTRPLPSRGIAQMPLADWMPFGIAATAWS
jgi:hypothetical protein